MAHMNLFFPQWQGAGRGKDLLKGALEIKEKYLRSGDFFDVAVSCEDNDIVTNNILGYESIVRQLGRARGLIAEKNPDTLFTVGGGCDVEVTSVSHLNRKLDGDLTVLWLDAHGDLNVPESSPSKHYHGMPLRTLLGEGDEEIVGLLFSKLSPSQLVMLGTRELDEPESRYIAEQKIRVFTPTEIESDLDRVLNAIKSKGSRNIYVHIDLDVLDPDLFPHVMCPTSNGLKTETLTGLLKMLGGEFRIAGMSLLEYISSGDRPIPVLSEIISMGVNGCRIP